MNKLKSVKHLTIAIFMLWAGSGLAIFYLFKNPTERGTFGDMFGAINALFSGIAFIGIAYAFVLQKSEIEESKYQFKLNFLLNLLSSQVNAFNLTLAEFKFDTNLDEIWITPKLVDFNTAIDLYDTIKESEMSVSIFVDKNRSRINRTTTFISDTFDFVKYLLAKEQLSDQDQKVLKRLFTRNINRNILDFISLALTESQSTNKQTGTSDSDMDSLIESINKIHLEKLRNVLDFLDYKTT
ncbi:MAG: hypothetical protein J0M25_14180 [Flavobacteriales bacterium]|nr:hypothetical protein [Flavobacteriales bacterium]